MPAQQTTLEELSKDLGTIATDLPAAVPGFLRACGPMIGGALKRDMTAGVSPDGTPFAPLKFPRARGGTKPLIDQGFLRASLEGGANHVERVEGSTLYVGTNRVGSSLMQDGGTVVAASGRALSIPMTPEAARAGSPRSFPRKLFLMWFTKSGGLFEVAETMRKKRSKSGSSSRVADKKPLTMQYLLVKKVVVPARPFVGFGAKLVDRLVKFANGYFRRALGGEAPTGGQPPAA